MMIRYFRLEPAQLPAVLDESNFLHDVASLLGADAVLLGPEPVIGRQAVAIAHGPSGRSIWVLTDGVRPFEVRWPAAAAGSNQG